MAFHFLEQGFVGGEERESHGFGQGNIDSIVDGKLIGKGNRHCFPQQVNANWSDIESQIIEGLDGGDDIGFREPMAETKGIGDI